MTAHNMDPGSAAHHHSASKTRVNALLVLRSVRGTNPGTRPGTFETNPRFNHGRTIGRCGGETFHMLAPSLLRAGLALKLAHVKLATRSYLRDRTDQATHTIASYAVATGLFAAAGIFLIAACLVGITALFRWIEINYGLFPAFGVVGGLLLIIAGILAAIAASKLKTQPPHFPSLTSRLRVAIKGNPIKANPVKPKPDQVEAARDTAAVILSAPASPLPGNGRRRQREKSQWHDNKAMPGLILVATLLGWAAVRRRSRTRQTAS
jgi:hypothetical protein